MSGVMPVIFAMTLCSLPNMVGSFLGWTDNIFFQVFNYTRPVYLVAYVLLIIGFNYFYVAIQYNPCRLYTSTLVMLKPATTS